MTDIGNTHILIALFVGFGFILIFMSKTIFNLIVYSMFALIMVAFVGYDPVTILVPLFFLIGISFRHMRFKRLGFPSLFNVLSFIFIASAVISFLWGPVWNWVIRFVSGIIFFYFLNLFIDSKEKMKYIFFSIIIGTLISSFVALLDLLGFISLGSMFFPVFDSFRFGGLYNTTMLGIFTAFLIIWVLDETMRPKLWKDYFLLKVIVLVLLLVQLIATLTRSAWLGLFLGMLTYLVVELYHSKLKRKIMIIIGVVFISSTLVHSIFNIEAAELIRKRLIEDTINRSEEEEKRAKFYFTKNALMLAMNHPFGVGIGNSQKNTENLGELEVGAHNNFVMVLSDMGWFAFFGFTASQIFICFRLLAGSLYLRQRHGLSSQMLLSNYVILLVAGMYQDLVLFIPMWLIPALSTIVIFHPQLDIRQARTLSQFTNSRKIECISG